MKILDSRFLRGPNVHHAGPCFMALLDLGDQLSVRVEKPAPASPLVLETAEVAQLISRLTFAAQAWAGSTPTFCETVRLGPAAPDQYRLLCGYQDEAVAKEALQLSMDFVTATLKQQPFDFQARPAQLQELASARAIAPASQAFLCAARERGIPVTRLEEDGPCFALGWGAHQKHYQAWPQMVGSLAPALEDVFDETDDGRIPIVAVTGTNGKTTTTLLISHVLRACGARTGTTTTQGIYIDGECVETGDCSGFWSARRVLTDPTVEVAALETARGGILKRGLAFDRCDVGVVLNVSSDHLGLDGVETLEEMAQVKGLVVRCARAAAVLNADDPLCVQMRDTLSNDCMPVFFSMNAHNQVLLEHFRQGGAGAFLDDEGWLVWFSGSDYSKVASEKDLPFTMDGHAHHNTANALAALAALVCLGHETEAIARSLKSFVSDARNNPLRGNLFEVDGIKLIVDYAHNAVAYRALCEMAQSIRNGSGRLLGVITAPGDRRGEDLYETGQVCGKSFDELVVYEHHPRGRSAGSNVDEILRGARSKAPHKPMRGELKIRQALGQGLSAARPGDVLVFTCAGTFEDLVEGIRLKSPAEADRIADELSTMYGASSNRRNDEKRCQ